MKKVKDACPWTVLIQLRKLWPWSKTLMRTKMTGRNSWNSLQNYYLILPLMNTRSIFSSSRLFCIEMAGCKGFFHFISFSLENNCWIYKYKKKETRKGEDHVLLKDDKVLSYMELRIGYTQAIFGTLILLSWHKFDFEQKQNEVIQFVVTVMQSDINRPVQDFWTIIWGARFEIRERKSLCSRVINQLFTKKNYTWTVFSTSRLMKDWLRSDVATETLDGALKKTDFCSCVCFTV